MAVIRGEGRVQILYGRSVLPVPPHRAVYLSRPDLVGRHPGVIVLGDASGVTSSVRDLCRRIARYGYVAVAPDLSRGEPAAEVTDTVMDHAIGDIVAVADAIRSSWDTFAAPIAPTVVALGGTALVGAGAAAEIGGPLVVLGGPVTDLESVLGGVTGPVLGLIAGDSEGGLEAVRELHDATGRGEWAVFPAVSPEFFDDAAEGFDQATFTDAFDRLIAFLDGHLAFVAAQ